MLYGSMATTRNRECAIRSFDGRGLLWLWGKVDSYGCLEWPEFGRSR
jgi:hypothetical protein